MIQTSPAWAWDHWVEIIGLYINSPTQPCSDQQPPNYSLRNLSIYQRHITSDHVSYPSLNLLTNLNNNQHIIQWMSFISDQPIQFWINWPISTNLSMIKCKILNILILLSIKCFLKHKQWNGCCLGWTETVNILTIINIYLFMMCDAGFDTSISSLLWCEGAKTMVLFVCSPI